MIDIDHFKKINDTYGHKVGDEILASFASEVKGMIRKSDILARIGGEEFTILLHDTSLDGARLIAEKLREIIEKKIFSFDDTSISISVSIGAAELSTSCSSIEELYKESDHRLYRAKEDGRNRVC